MSEPLPDAEIEAKVVEAIADQLGIPKSDVTPTSEFNAICDSLDKAELMMEFEDLFEISITDDSATKLTTVSDAVRYIQRTMKES